MGTIERDDKKLNRTTVLDTVSSYPRMEEVSETDQTPEPLTRKRTRFIMEFNGIKEQHSVLLNPPTIRNYHETPPCDFRPLGLSILNPAADCQVFHYGLSNYIMTSAPVSAQYFRPLCVKTLEELKMMAAEHRELLPLTSWIGGVVVHPGQNINLTLSGQCEGAIVWGDLVHRAMPVHKASVVKTGNMYHATLEVRQWDDEPFETVLDARTLSEEGGLMLLQTELQKYGRHGFP